MLESTKACLVKLMRSVARQDDGTHGSKRTDLIYPPPPQKIKKNKRIKCLSSCFMYLHRGAFGDVNIPRMSQSSKSSQTITSSTGFQRTSLISKERHWLTHPVIWQFPPINQLGRDVQRNVLRRYDFVCYWSRTRHLGSRTLPRIPLPLASHLDLNDWRKTARNSELHTYCISHWHGIIQAVVIFQLLEGIFVSLQLAADLE